MRLWYVAAAQMAGSALVVSQPFAGGGTGAAGGLLQAIVLERG